MKGLWLLCLLLMNGAMIAAKAGNDRQTIYCIGNHDATGACWKAGSKKEEKLGCVITSWPIVECQSILENDEKLESYECLALQNTGIVNQISLSCQSQASNTTDKEADSPKQEIPKSTFQPEPATTTVATDQATVLESEESIPNAFLPRIENTTFGVEQPHDFKDAF